MVFLFAVFFSFFSLTLHFAVSFCYCIESIDLKQMQAAFLLQWVGRLFQAQALDKWSHVPKNIVAPFGDKYLCFFSNPTVVLLKDYR